MRLTLLPLVLHFFESSHCLLRKSLATTSFMQDQYPERLKTAFIVDAPSVFYYLWKVRPFARANSPMAQLWLTFVILLGPFAWTFKVRPFEVMSENMMVLKVAFAC